ncbi:MAG: hypothetical protein ACR2JK_16710 [Geodermatophilaceae bacterium]
MAGSTERTSSRRRAWDTAAVLLSVLLVTLGTVYLGSNYTGPIASVAFGLLLGGQALLARYRPLTAWVVLVAAMRCSPVRRSRTRPPRPGRRR